MISRCIEWLEKLGIFKFITKAWHEHRQRMEATDELLNELPRIRECLLTNEKVVEELKSGMVEELHTTLDSVCYLIINRGFATEAEFSRLDEVYKVYHDLGGNGSGTKLYNQAAQLPIKENDNEF